MNSYHASRLARLLASSQDESPQDQSSQDQSPQEPSVTDLMSNAYHQALLTTDLAQHYHPLPRLLYEPQDRIDGYWTVTWTRPSFVQLQITIRPALHSDPPSHHWRSMRSNQIQGPITFRISTQNAMRELSELRRVPGTVSRACHRFAYTIELGTSDRVPFQILRRPVDGDRI
ncbi:uncharacterized protein FFB20_06303 [Fusarium fujikuroi]|uniref:Uncharacterized protein n=1 Tax=Fusarium fujikuroi TaxID=5127 RepID=A0A2H3SA79_FUSFU|nr:uncharacterized protein Y057_13435 [Fusarium fujikuroi]QGI62868.1 hypothetical protein CEK27_006839 [Fusarium fujikuroi]QGI80038.1 hypothetical protein CEK25_006767 [Fusarium fujikuroi]QGI93754.1 hypothetical protein CEK26_006823 [Fusarium fujikuroi]SCN80960.1 uncharacterized protein FFB20_06303 [Fusarium fujikuroi]